MRGLISWLRQYWWSAAISLIAIYPTLLFTYSYGWRFIVHDQWWSSLPIAMETHNGSLSLGDLLATIATGHKIFFTQLHTAILTRLNHWDIGVELIFSPLLAGLTLALLLFLFWRQLPDLLQWALPIFSLLIFALCQGFNWIFSLESAWYFTNFFLVMALAVVTTTPPGWRPLLVTAGLAFCGTIALGHGMVIWGAILIVLILHGYRALPHYLVWIGLTSAALYYYFSTSQIDTTGQELTSLTIPPIKDAILFFPGFLGAPLSGGSFTLAALMGVLGAGLFFYNSYLLWQQEQSPQKLAVWWGCATFGVGTALVLSLTRLDGYRPELVALIDRYTTVSVIFWIGVAGVTIPNLKYPRLHTLYAIFFALAVILNLQLGLQTIQAAALKNGHMIGSDDSTIRQQWEKCLAEYPLYRDEQCLDTVLNPGSPGDRIYQLAVYRFSVFADVPQVNVLPNTYQHGSPILVNSPSLWLNAYIKDYLLHGIPPDQLLHLAPVLLDNPNPFITRTIENDRYLRALPHQVHDLSAELAQVDQFINHAEQVWYITTPETAATDSLIFDRLAAQGYLATPYPIQHPYYRLAEFTIYRFQLPPDQLATTLYFGEEKISLQAWSLFADEPLEPCENLRVQSWWSSASVPQFNYSTTFVLIAPDGTAIAQKDAAIGDTLLQLWQPGTLYLDERLLTVPCEAPPGEYQVSIGIYLNTGSGFEDLPAYDPAGDPLGTRAVITTVRVE